MIFEELQSIGLPVVYGVARSGMKPPYLSYRGNGQDTMAADNSYIWRENTYVIEYYFTKKDSEQEDQIEQTLLENGYLYEKSEDVYMEEDGVFLIYYYI